MTKKGEIEYKLGNRRVTIEYEINFDEDGNPSVGKLIVKAEGFHPDINEGIMEDMVEKCIKDSKEKKKSPFIEFNGFEENFSLN